MVSQEAWQLEGSAAELYERHLVPAISSLWAADLVERAAPQAGERVLDCRRRVNSLQIGRLNIDHFDALKVRRFESGAAAGASDK